MKILLTTKKLIGGRISKSCHYTVFSIVYFTFTSCCSIGYLRTNPNNFTTSTGNVKIVTKVLNKTRGTIFFCMSGSGYTFSQDAPEMFIKGYDGQVGNGYRVDRNTGPYDNGYNKNAEKYDIMVTFGYALNKKNKKSTSSRELIIPPCDFIMCKGERVLNDTIRIVLP